MKLRMVLEYRGLIEAHVPKEDLDELQEIVDKYQTRSETFNSTGKK